MKNTWIVLFVIVVTMFAANALAVDFEKVLVPISIFSVGAPGAFGSLWKSEFIGRNDSDMTVIIQPVHFFPIGCSITCPNYNTSPHTTFKLFDSDSTGAFPGRFEFVSKPGNDRVSFNVRVFDVSRESLTWGTEVPVVRESEARTGSITLLNVPTDARFRTMLRVYDFDGALDRTVVVRFFGINDETPLAERTLALSFFRNYVGDPQDVPGYAQVGNFTDAFPQLVGVDRLRVEIVPSSPGMRFWAFISVTNNETQHFTIITPH